MTDPLPIAGIESSVKERAASTDIVAIQGLTCRFGDLTAVDGVTLSIRTGEVFGLLGPNGAGKSTLMKALTTLLPPTAGTAQVAGFDIRSAAAQVRARIAYVPQLVSADGALTGRENLRLFARLHGVHRREVESRVHEALRVMGLDESANRLARTYSGGMVRRLEIAMALIHRPSVVFLDEPTVGLDPIARQLVWQQVRLLVRDLGMTILLTTHLMEEADSLCDRVAIMIHGRVVAIGHPDDLKAELAKPSATLDDVFTHHSGQGLEVGGNIHEISRSRKNLAHRG